MIYEKDLDSFNKVWAATVRNPHAKGVLLEVDLEDAHGESITIQAIAEKIDMSSAQTWHETVRTQFNAWKEDKALEKSIEVYSGEVPSDVPTGASGGPDPVPDVPAPVPTPQAVPAVVATFRETLSARLAKVIHELDTNEIRRNTLQEDMEELVAERRALEVALEVYDGAKDVRQDSKGAPSKDSPARPRARRRKTAEARPVARAEEAGGAEAG